VVGGKKNLSANNPRFCGQDEEHDPSEEFEEYLECVICGNNAHRQCARDEDALESDEDASAWRCKVCVDSGAPPESNLEQADPIRKTARELLSDLRGTKHVDSPDFDSVVDDDPLDGSRPLRKRKASDTDPSHRPLRKRSRPDSITASGGADRSPSVISANGNDIDVDEQSGRPLRPRRRKSEKPLVHAVNAHGASLILSFNLDRERMQKILSSKPKKNRNVVKPKRKAPPLIIEDEPPHYPPLPSSQLFSFFERSHDDPKKPYGGILSEGEADTSKTLPGLTDREIFEKSRLRVEDDWKKKIADTNNIPEPTKPSQKMSGPPSKIKCINFGGYEIDTWNTAPYPEEYSRNKIIYICEFCLKYMNSDFVAWRHKVSLRSSLSSSLTMTVEMRSSVSTR
jgi:histone acetyltransferase SAS3